MDRKIHETKSKNQPRIKIGTSKNQEHQNQHDLRNKKVKSTKIKSMQPMGSPQIRQTSARNETAKRMWHLEITELKK